MRNVLEFQDARTSLLEDRNRLTAAITDGTLYKTSPSEVKERYLKKMSIFDQKKSEEIKDVSVVRILSNVFSGMSLQIAMI